jgi:hypothetical protein
MKQDVFSKQEKTDGKLREEKISKYKELFDKKKY